MLVFWADRVYDLVLYSALAAFRVFGWISHPVIVSLGFQAGGLGGRKSVYEAWAASHSDSSW